MSDNKQILKIDSDGKLPHNIEVKELNCNFDELLEIISNRDLTK